MATQDPHHHHHAHAGEKDHNPSHSGAAISILKITPQTDAGIVVTSPDIGLDGVIDPRFSADGDNVSPALQWTDVEGAGAYVLIVEDPDAPMAQPYIHWMIWNLPGQLNMLDGGVPREDRLVTPQDAIQGRNDAGEIGWYGPKPPPGHGVHHYHFQLFAIDSPLTVDVKADLQTLVDSIKGRTLASGELIGTFEVPDTDAIRPA